MSQTDARTRFTRMVISDCFLTLLQQKPVAKITVTELCQLAQINRATFYRHYLDIPDLMEKLEEELFDKTRQIYQQN
ncbi:MAG: TetR/AcrR family transcriptional regulator, partial [bacterium]|nr:TetR/AcrR family transcriptional regulator [bacterium]